MPGCTRETVAEYLKVYEAVRKERHDKVKDTRYVISLIREQVLTSVVVGNLEKC